MGSIFLGGGGSELDSRELDALFARAVQGCVLYVPHAMPRERFVRCETWFKKVMESVGLTFVTADELPASLAEYGAVYLGGGNTYRLLQTIKDAGFDTTLQRFIEGGGVVYGGSAGAIILGKDIRTAREYDEEPAENTSTQGLNLLNEVSVLPHHTDEKRAETLAKTLRTDILAIPEQGGAILHDNKWTFIGTTHIINKE